jgi:hypothetical protein
MNRYGSNKVKEVSNKVEEVKAVMRENVDLALSNVDKLEVMEEKAGNQTSLICLLSPFIDTTVCPSFCVPSCNE